MTSNDPVAGPMLTVVMNGQAVIDDRQLQTAGLSPAAVSRPHGSGIWTLASASDGRQETSPDMLTRARFVATSLVEALVAENDSVAAATCAYLALRLPELKQVRADRKDGQMHIDLVFDEPHVQTQTVHFVRPDGGSGLH